MMKIKTAQFGPDVQRPDFTNLDVRRLMGNMREKQFGMQEKLKKIEQINNQMDELKMSNPHITLPDIQTQSPELWQMFEDIMEGDWSINPNQ